MPTFDYPLLLDPIPVPRPWGGGRVCRLYGRSCTTPRPPLPEEGSGKAQQPIGEWWDVSTWPTDPGNPGLPTVTKIINGPLGGRPLDEVVDVPVVVKLLDSAELLSVQAHPVLPDEHKDEMWYVLYAEPGAYLFCGLAEGVDPAAFCNLIKSDNPCEEEVLAMLHRSDGLRPGSSFSVPSGTVHAVGPGLVAFEISERTQVTYRLYDYNRGRELHLEEGCRAVMASRPYLPPLEPGFDIDGAETIESLTEFPTFCVLRVVGRNIAIRSAQHLHLVTATGGPCRLKGPNDLWGLSIPQAGTCLVPPTAQTYTIESSGELLLSALRD